ncbi:MAG: murein hydrolase activator EnvC family protein [Desulfovibrionaceae bacterium]
MRTFLLKIVFYAFYTAYSTDSFAQTNTLEKELEQKKTVVKQQKETIKELTQEEKMVKTDLQKAQNAVKKMEDSIAKQQLVLNKLQQKATQIMYQLEYLQKQKQKREKHIETLLNALWPLHIKQFQVPHQKDFSLYEEERDYIWVQYIMNTVEEEYQKLAQEETETTLALEKQNNNYIEQENVSKGLEKQLNALLVLSVDYNKKLNAIQKNRKTAEQELQGILNIIIGIQDKLEDKKNVGKITAKTKGFLPSPVQGAIKVHYAPFKSPPVKGIGFATADNISVSAIADGKVVHNDILRGFGKVVIVAHGGSYYSLYAFLSSSPLEVNSNIQQGSKIGNVGFYPEVNGSGLYFELRKNEKTVDPKQWIKK